MDIFIFPCDHCNIRKKCEDYSKMYDEAINSGIIHKQVFSVIYNIFCINYDKKNSIS